MSLLIAVLDAFDFQEPKIELLPASRSELYQLAMQAVSDAKLVSTLGLEPGSNALAEARKALWAALQVVCTKNHFGAGNEARRIFNTRDVEEMLKSGTSGLADADATSATAAFLKCMGASSDAYRVPGLKVLEESKADFAAIDTDGDGRISAVEAAAAVTGITDAIFTAFDANSDGFWSRAEFDNWDDGKVIATLQTVHISMQEHFAAGGFLKWLGEAVGGSGLDGVGPGFAIDRRRHKSQLAVGGTRAAGDAPTQGDARAGQGSRTRETAAQASGRHGQ